MSNRMVTIDVSNIKTANQLHRLLKEKLDFPEFYGENWNAFWDAITGLIDMPNILIIKGWNELEINLPNDAKIFKECLIEYNQYYSENQCDFLFDYPEN